MDHQQVRDGIDDAFATPGARDADDTVARQIRAHLAACVDCTSYDEATRRAALKLDLARGPSPEVRTRLLAAAQRSRRARGLAAPRPNAQPWWQRPMAWRLGAAALVLAFVGATGGAWWAGSQRQDTDADHLADAVAMMTTLAADHHAQEVVLRDTAGKTGGLAVISGASHQMAIFATHLTADVEYHCYLERTGQWTWIGTMYATPGVEFWAGVMDPGIDMQPGDVLVVAADPGQPAMLSAAL
ncbi:MAG: hypothetical protein ABI744_03165 [Chloroflexota bacterium]